MEGVAFAKGSKVGAKCAILKVGGLKSSICKSLGSKVQLILLFLLSKREYG